jgi:thioredoxin-like negative regulator of GroEL
MSQRKEVHDSGQRSIDPRLRIAAVVAVVTVLAVLVVFKTMAAYPAAPVATAPAEGAVSATTAQSPSAPSQSRADALVAYDEALKTGRPIYLLFHSLTCVPCVEISAVVDKVIPGYQGKVVFVNAITTEQSAQDLAAKFKFQYIPTSFFIKPDGTVSDSFTGTLTDAEMKARLDKLIAQ